MRGVVYFCLFCVVTMWPALNAEQVDAAGRAQDGGVVNYAEVRARLARSLPEKANEIGDFIDTLQDISKATVEKTNQISAHCAQ